MLINMLPQQSFHTGSPTSKSGFHNIKITYTLSFDLTRNKPIFTYSKHNHYADGSDYTTENACSPPLNWIIL